MAVTPSFPAKTVPEFMAYAKENPGKINMASGGIGSLPHVAGELFKFMTGINLVHVPYRGSYLPDLIGGQVQVAFGPIPTLIEQIRAGKLRALAVTGAEPSAALPGLPTLSQFVPGYEASVTEYFFDAEIEHDAVATVQFERVLSDLEDFLRSKHFGHVAQRVGVRRVVVDGS